MKHEELAQILFAKICTILKQNDLKLRIMQRRGPKSGAYTMGYINFKTKVITLDIYTAKTLKPKSINGLIRTIVHEITHWQKPPFKQRYRGKWITRQHYPEFYQQITENLKKIKADPILGGHFQK